MSEPLHTTTRLWQEVAEKAEEDEFVRSFARSSLGFYRGFGGA